MDGRPGSAAVPPARDAERAALIVAHPGHELRVHRWLEVAQPLTFVLTKGDGHACISRLESTTRVLASANAPPGRIYGRFRDTEFYAALLRRDCPLFLSLLDELADALVAGGITYVAADAAEGYNPAHDLCRSLGAAAAAMTARATSRTVRDFDFTLVGAPDACPDELRAGAIRLELDDEALARKMEAAQTYPGLGNEVAHALAAHGASAFRVECLRPATAHGVAPLAHPFYEEYGDRRVATGDYAEVVTYADHLLPVRNAILTHAGVGP